MIHNLKSSKTNNKITDKYYRVNLLHNQRFESSVLFYSL